MAKFTGFPPATRTFLRQLARHNEKRWFDAHRADYEAYYLQPAQAFVEAIGPKLTQLSPGLTAIPKVNGSIFRINRDVRFSKDKTPYKDHIDLWFWEGSDRKQGSSGFFFRLRPDQLLLGAGIHGFAKPQLAAYREAVVDDTAGAALEKIVRKLGRSGYPVQGLGYKKVPRGFDPDHPRADLLKHSALHAGVTLHPLPAEVESAKLVTLCVGHYRKLLPLHRWLVEHVQA